MTEKELIAMALKRGGKLGQSADEAMRENRPTGAAFDNLPQIRVRTAQHQTGRLNKTEASHARQLDLRIELGEVAFYWFESVKLRLADKTWYTPDFFVVLADGGIEIHEVKGFWRDDARIKFKAVAEAYPCFLFIAFSKTGEERYGRK